MLQIGMGARRTVWIIAALAALVSAEASRAQEADPGTPEPTIAELEALYRTRVDGARMRFIDADVQFMTGMIGHHAQALVMAAMAPTHGASPSVRTLAARIDNAQHDEIETMQRWLRDRAQPVPEVHIQGTTLMIHGSNGHMDHAHMSMPGMLTQAQLDELDAARGGDFDRLFLTYMIQHHGGAIVMVEDLVATDGGAQGTETFKLASDIQVDQRTEIARMQRMLDALPSSAP